MYCNFVLVHVTLFLKVATGSIHRHVSKSKYDNSKAVTGGVP